MKKISYKRSNELMKLYSWKFYPGTNTVILLNSFKFMGNMKILKFSINYMNLHPCNLLVRSLNTIFKKKTFLDSLTNLQDQGCRRWTKTPNQTKKPNQNNSNKPKQSKKPNKIPHIRYMLENVLGLLQSTELELNVARSL